jgi:HAD superfamily hydrolase (TIGR01456 family)
LQTLSDECNPASAGLGFCICFRVCIVATTLDLIYSLINSFLSSIDGVLLRASKPIPGAAEALKILTDRAIPFIFLTNGGGRHETERVAEISQRLGVPLDPSFLIQSHSPFAEFVEGTVEQAPLKERCVLVVGGDGDSCRKVAEAYGLECVVTPGDIYHAYPTIWPFSKNFNDYYATFARPLPKPIDPSKPSSSLKLDAIFVFNDPRDWALDIQIIMDALLSSQGIMGTFSSKNGRHELPNCGYQEDGQPPLYFSNPDLWWAAAYHLNRLGQGGFREALEGVWAATTGGPSKGVKLRKTLIGKPYHHTYAFAERQLIRNWSRTSGNRQGHPLRRVFMIGDNPESDIRGANSYRSEHGSEWISILVRSGVYSGGEPTCSPRIIVDDVYDAVQWALESCEQSGSKRLITGN